MAAPDDVPEDLLEGTEGRARTARAELVHDLLRAGVAEDEVRRAVASGRLAMLPVEVVLRADDEALCVEDIARETGVTPEDLEAQRRATGLPVPARGERGYTGRDRATGERLRAALDTGLPREAITEMSRVFGEAASRAAAAATAVVAASMAREGDTERDVALRLAHTADVLGDRLSEVLGDLAHAHLLEQVSHQAVAAEEIRSGRLVGGTPVTIGFADLVGYTKLGSRVDAAELGAVSGRLTALATDALREPTRLVKTIGDAIMLAGPDPTAVVRSAVALLAAVAAEEDLPELRAGVATGEAVPRYGDWYGSTVNLASRACGVARPGTLLVDETTREAVEPDLAEELAFARTRRRRLKGLGDVRLHRVRVEARDPEQTG